MILNLSELSDEPLHAQISRQIRAKILSGDLDSGDALPSIRRQGPVVLIVDNDPRILNPLVAAEPEALGLMIETRHPKTSPELAAGIARAPDFTSLIPEGFDPTPPAPESPADGR